MSQRNSLLWVLASLVVLRFLPRSSAVCPWEMSGLENWSNPATWPSGVPAANTSVVIPAGKKVLLDTDDIPRLLTLTIDGTLVWGNVDNIRLETSYILVNGEFHIGSENCNFEKTADIFLYGKSNAAEQVSGFGRKFIGATAGSTLEIHGKQKQSWTKLVQTVEPVKFGSCGYVYDSRDEDLGTKLGLHIHVWNPDGTVYDTHQYNTAGSSGHKKAKNMVNYIAGIPSGKIIAIAVYRTMGVPSSEFDNLYTSIEGLGGGKIRDVNEYEPYILVAETGNSASAVDYVTKRLNGVDGGLEAEAALMVGDFVFKANSISYNTNYFDETIFRVVDKMAARPKLSFLHDVTSWNTGDEIVVASTDFDWRQAEVRKIVECTDCDANQIRVDGDFRYTHFGEVTYGVDERGEVGLLSRNIRIEGELQKECYNFTVEEGKLCELFNRDTYGAHTKVLKDASAKIEGVQLTHMGQQSVLATYPLHYHMCDGVPGQYVRNNVVRDSNSRCVTIHGTDYLEVSNIVCLNHLGHGIFLEDSAEQNNTIHRNLVIGTQHGTLLFTDQHEDWCENRDFCNLLSSFWITHPNNIITDNVAAGSDGFGISLTFSDRPLGLSLQRQIDRGLFLDMGTRFIKVPEFSRNVVHSNKKDGLWFDARVSYSQTEDGEFYPINAKMGLDYYNPREPPTPDGTLVETVIYGMVLYKNQKRNAWVRCGNIAIVNSSFADSRISYLGAHSTAETSCDVRHSIFIGETDNKGQPLTYVFNDPQFDHLPKSDRPTHRFSRSLPEDRPDFMINGVSFYQGPVYIENCYFDQFINWFYNDSLTPTLGYRPHRPATAITFHPNNYYPTAPTSGVKNVKFGYCDGINNSFRIMNGNASTPQWKIYDGTGNTNIKDYDGSLSGLPGVQLVQNRPFFTEPGCFFKSQWGLSICRRDYLQMVVRGNTGVLQYEYRGHYPVRIIKDTQPQDPYIQAGERGHKYILLANESYTIKFNESLGETPQDILLRPRFGLQSGEVIRLALCLPKSTTQFKIKSDALGVNSNDGNIVWVDNLAALDADTTMKAYFWDQTNGYLYFKMSSTYSLDDPDQRCPGDQCIDLTIKREDGDNGPAVCTAPVTPYVHPDEQPFEQLVEPACNGIGTSDGLGAPIETGFAAPQGAACV